MTAQLQQPIPKLGAAFVNPDGTVSFAWYRFLITLWQRSGSGKGAATTAANAVYFVSSAAGIGAYLVADNTFLGYLSPSGSSGGPAVPVVAGSSPFVYSAPGPGFIIVSSGKLELSRDSGGTWYTVGLQGGSVPVTLGDLIRVTWTTSAPTITLFPNT